MTKSATFRKFSQFLLVVALFLFAIVFRLWFISLDPQPFAWDQDEYQWYATKIFYQPQMLASHSYRSYPYPLFMAIVYKFTGFKNHDALFTAQAVNDAITGLFVFLILKAVVKKPKITAYIGYILYIINPFTSGYVGVGLSEVLSAFFITGSVLVGIRFIRKPNIFSGFLLGLFAGFAAETRNAAFAWAAVPILLAILLIKWKKHLLAVTFICIGVFTTMTYPLYVNWRDYHEISFTTVDSIFARELFNGVVLKVLPPFTYNYPPVIMNMYWEYYSEFYPERTAADRKAMADKYLNMAINLIKADPADYIRWRFFKMWYVWQKENIFFYKEPFFSQTKAFVYYGNLGLLFLASVGFITGAFIQKEKIARFVWFSIIGTVLYGTFAFAFSHAEYRLTIPFYPLLILSAAYGITRIHEVISLGRGISRKRKI